MGEGVCVQERTRGEMGGCQNLLMLPRKEKIICINIDNQCAISISFRQINLHYVRTCRTA